MLSIEAWMQTVDYKKHEEYILAGQSLGGYISVLYSMRYPKNLSRLVLLSPVGVPPRPENFTIEKLREKIDSKARRMMLDYADN